MVNQFKMVDFCKACLTPAVEDSVGYCMLREPFFHWVKENTSDLNEPLIKALASNLTPLGEAGEEFLNNFVMSLKQKGDSDQLIELLRGSLLRTENNDRPTNYDGLVKIGFTGELRNGGFGSPAESVLGDVKKIKFTLRGLSTDSRGNLILNANIFASYVLKRINLVQLENGQMYVYSKKGYYIELNDRLLKTLCRSILHEAKPNIWIRKWETEYFEALKREIPYVDCMNSEKHYVNLTNGMLNMYSMEFVNHDPSFLSTIQIPIGFDVNATCPEFQSFLPDIFEGDDERINLIQEWMGYCFLHEIKIQKALFFIGSGSNGKSVLSEVIRNLVGIENVSNVALKDLGGRFGMQNLPGKLVNISTENEFDRKFNTQNFKMLTAGDAVNVEQKFKSSFSTQLCAKTVVLLNSMMDSNDLTNGFFRRLQLIPFNKTYREQKAYEFPIEGLSYMDKSLTDRLLTELPGILNFALAGLSRLIQNDFNLTESKVCEQALEQYKISQNPIPEYLNARVYQDENTVTKRRNFKEDFSKWAENNGLDNLKSIGSTKFWDLFNRALTEQGIKVREKKINGDFYVEGLGVWV